MNLTSVISALNKSSVSYFKLRGIDIMHDEVEIERIRQKVGLPKNKRII